MIVMKRLLSLILALMLMGAALFFTWDTIMYKLHYYLSGNAGLEGNAIRFIAVSSFKDLYKLPLTYLFSMVFPLGMFQSVHSYYDVVCTANILLVPIAVGAALYFFRKKPDPLFYFGCLAYYLISIIPSIAIFRHYFSLMPLNLMAFGAWTADMNRRQKILWLCLTAAMALVLCACIRRGGGGIPHPG